MDLSACTDCPLFGNSVVVPPEGTLTTAKLVIVGQAPGWEEEREGRPFVGASGRKLFSVLATLGIDRDRCYITNIAKCKPPRRADGTGDEEPSVTVKKHCHKAFFSEWAQIKGKVILVLGTPATKQMTRKSLSSVRGTVITEISSPEPGLDGPQKTSYLCTWHPAYILRAPGHERLWVKDLSLLGGLLSPEGRKMAPFEVISSDAECQRIGEFLLDLPLETSFSVDIETTTKTPFDADARILSLALAASGIPIVYVFDFRRLGPAGIDSVRRILTSGHGKIAQNAKFEYVWLKEKLGIEFKPVVFDPAAAQYLLDEGAGMTVRLKQLVWRYLPEYGGYEDGIDPEKMQDLRIGDLARYNATDAYVTLKIAEILRPEIDARGFSYVLDNVLLPGIYPLGEMEVAGLKTDDRLLTVMGAELQSNIASLEERIMADPDVRAIEGFALTSTPALRKLVYDRLGFRHNRTSKTGLRMLRKEDLEGFADSVQAEASGVLRDILEYKTTSKLFKAYFENYYELVGADGFMHPVYNMLIARGGRLSSGNPNIQAVPKSIRKLFVSRFENGWLLQSDFKQIEVRVMAILSNDQALIEVFHKGGDPHREIAAEILGVAPEAITNEQRAWAKTVVFGLLYGMQLQTLIMRERMPAAAARLFYEGFFSRFSGVARWQRNQRAIAESEGKVRTLFGRVRDISAYRGEDRIKRSYNTPNQGTAADINLFSLGLIHQLKNEAGLRSVMIANVHDSFLADCPSREEAEELSQIAKSVVVALPSFFPWMTVPMDIDVKIGKTWEEVS
jgi:uracil-DNA glycosylase family 4